MLKIYMTSVTQLDDGGLAAIEVAESQHRLEAMARSADRYYNERAGYTPVNRPETVPVGTVPVGVHVEWWATQLDGGGVNLSFTTFAVSQKEANDIAHDICDRLGWDTEYWEVV